MRRPEEILEIDQILDEAADRLATEGFILFQPEQEATQVLR